MTICYDNVGGSIEMTSMNNEVSKTANTLNFVGKIIATIGKVGHCCFNGHVVFTYCK
jgi:Na+/H+-translocating membrane pyrophosphatase